MAASGGYGNAFERDPVAVAEDVLEQKMTAARAKERYGVVIDAATNQVDAAATASERASKRAEKVPT